MDLTSFTKKLTPNGFRPKSKSQNHETMYLLCLEDNIGKNLDDPGYTGGFLGVVQHQGHEKTSLINWNLLKYKTSVLKKTRSEREDKSQTGTKYLQKTHLIKDSCLNYTQNSQWENEWPNCFKMGKRPGQSACQRRWTEGRWAHGRMWHLVCHQGNANGNREAPPHTRQNPDTDNTQGWQAGSNRHSYPLLAGRHVAAATSKASLVDSYKTELTLTVRSSNHAPCYAPKGVASLCPQNPCTWSFVASLFIITEVT